MTCPVWCLQAADQTNTPASVAQAQRAATPTSVFMPQLGHGRNTPLSHAQSTPRLGNAVHTAADAAPASQVGDPARASLTPLMFKSSQLTPAQTVDLLAGAICNILASKNLAAPMLVCSMVLCTAGKKEMLAWQTIAMSWSSQAL